MSGGKCVEKLRYLAKPKWDRVEPVLDFAGSAGSVVGRGIGYFIGLLIMIVFQLSVWTALVLYVGWSALLRWIREQRTEYQRRYISPEERKLIAESQDWKCYYGHMPLPPTGFDIDHKRPFSDIKNYGADPNEIEATSNLVATCPKHNRQKGDMDEDEYWEWMEEYDQVSCNSKLGE